MSKSKELTLNEKMLQLAEIKRQEAKDRPVTSKRFVIRKSLIGQGKIIEMVDKAGTAFKYNHDYIFTVFKDRFESMPCWDKYNYYSQSNTMPKFIRDVLGEDLNPEF
jgi:hypothetical protein